MKHIVKYFSEDKLVRLDCFISERSPEGGLNRARGGVLVCPGGGYAMCSDLEAEPIALRYAAAGFQAFVLRYTVGDKAVFPTPLIELGKAVKYIRENAEEFNLIPNQLALCGFSAGGHLAASLGVYWNDPDILAACSAKERELRPDLLILGYPVISTSWMHNCAQYARIAGDPNDESIAKKLNLHIAVNADTPPAFITHGTADPGVPVRDSLKFACALEEHDVPIELHLYSHMWHGFSTADDVTCDCTDPAASQWIALSVLWLKRQFDGGELGRPVNKAAYSANY